MLRLGVMLFMKTIRKYWFIVLIVIALVAVVAYIFVRSPEALRFNKGFVPPEFLEARTRGAMIAEDIVGLSKESISNLSNISADEEIGNYTGGLNLVLKEVENNEKARSSALELSKELGIMATNLGSVRPDEAAKVGLEAVINESQIVQRLINYNAYALQLVDSLQGRFTGGGRGPATDGKIKELLSKMNEEARAINELNSKYKDLMARFNTLTGSK